MMILLVKKQSHRDVEGLSQNRDSGLLASGPGSSFLTTLLGQPATPGKAGPKPNCLPCRFQSTFNAFFHSNLLAQFNALRFTLASLPWFCNPKNKPLTPPPLPSPPPKVTKINIPPSGLEGLSLLECSNSPQ